MGANGPRLAGITKDLWHQWQDTKNYWRDAKSDEFQKKYLDELMNSVDKTVATIDQIEKLIAKIRTDCE